METSVMHSPLRGTIERSRQKITGPRQVLPTRYRNILHTYQALPAWSADGQKLLYAGFDDYAHGDIVIRSMETGEETSIANTSNFDYHCAAWQHWALGDSAVLFHGQERTDTPFPSLVRLDAPFQIEPVTALAECLIRQVIAHGSRAVFYRHPNGRRLGRTGIYDLQTGQHPFLLETEEAAEGVVHGEKPDPRLISFQHVVANPSGTRIFFKMDHRTPEGAVVKERSFHAFDISSRRCIDFGTDILGHPAWLDDRYIVNIQKTHDGSNFRWLVAMDTESGSVHRLLDTPLTGAGHPCVSPDGRWLASDAFTADQQTAILYLLDLQSGVIREFDRFAQDGKPAGPGVGYNPHVITRAHPHPTWSPDSRFLLANCNFGGDHLGLLLWEVPSPRD